eukprot:TRINITY_DN17235_c0_g1::TRINITY_DN17235_c0_g1_i1::g.7721::m.7721 TRINITY_DN17235_c0_g1::TRINITY_DN17235_c0_g1_i1::g.7721  ORF type:complete len:270 (+),score=6.48,sp/A5PJS2/S5A1_BOVIN/51.74/4e-82,Steroid_dh/PF02544.11/2.1e-53,DUF1295/PF06966.7/6.2e+03,DUF1295/PF06966.7/2.7e-05,PEMT/PF04191.8/2.6e+03,PEMT/PF04191.8/0.38 TRINITY_DN17235_c0_g1_i1:47-811(+)
MELMDKESLDAVAIIMMITGLCSFISLFFTTAPYGRYSAGGIWGFLLPARVAWVLQEFPCVAWCVSTWYTSNGLAAVPFANKILFSLFLFHYVNRTFIFPLRIRGGKPTPVTVFGLAFLFCVINGYLQSVSLSTLPLSQSPTDPRFISGVFLFFLGLLINWHADHVLIHLRKPGETGYKIPRGGMFEYVSGANFFGEILEWAGFALAASSLHAAAFAFFTFCNIGPRGYQHHKWYHEKFEDYPKSRRAVIPFLW